MRCIAFGDIGSNSYANIEQVIEEYQPELVLCTGGFGSVDSVYDHIQFLKVSQSQNRRVITVPSQEDVDLVTLLRASKFGQGNNATKRERELRKYLRQITTPKNGEDPVYHVCRGVRFAKERFQDQYQCALMRQAFAGSIPATAAKMNPLLAYRLTTVTDHYKNWKTMQSTKIRVLINTNFDTPFLVEYQKKSDENLKIVHSNPVEQHQLKQAYLLLPQHRYVISSGAYRLGFYALIQESEKLGEHPILSFHHIRANT